VPIISLIDILAILLIFFIATTTFKRRESLVKVNLPQSSEMAASREKIYRVALALSKDEEIALGDRPLTLETLPQELRQFKAANPEAKLELKADEGVPIGFLVKVWDAASKADVRIDEIPLRILLQKSGK
jgi:biopolymer transport protein ExbD